MFDGLKQIVDVIGLEASLRLIAAWGGLTLYVPGEYDKDHLITKVVGEDAAKKLEDVFGGQTVSIPISLNAIKHEVGFIRLIAKGLTPRDAAHFTGITYERAKQIVARHWPGGKDEAVAWGRAWASQNETEAAVEGPGDPGGQAGRGAGDPRKSGSAKR